MNINEILIMIGFGAGILIIGGWVIIFYATVRHEDYKNTLNKKEKFENNRRERK